MCHATELLIVLCAMIVLISSIFPYKVFICFLYVQCARQGFALGMTVLVGTVPCIKVGALLKLIVELLEISSSMKGQVGMIAFVRELISFPMG